MENNKNPNIRFKGFTDPWEQRKLKEILIQRTEHQKISDDAPLLAFSYAEGVISPEDKKSNKRDFIMTDKYNKIFSRTELNDIIYNPANVVHGAIHRNKLGTGVVSPIYKIFMCNGVSPKFIGERLHTDKFILEVTKFIEGTVVKLRTLSPEMFLEMSIEIPKSYEEQDRIGTYFTNLDNLITLHQRKYNKLLNVKKSMLEKMFPKNGSNIPEIRFKGFTDPWEQRKLGDLGSLKNGMNFSKDAMGHGYAFVNLQNIFGNNVVEVKSLGLAEASEKQLLEYSLQKGDVLFVRSSVKLEGVGEAALVAETLENTTYSGFIIRFRDEYGLNNDFKKFVFATKKVRDQIMSQATNSANKNISQSVLENLTFEIPSKDEQKQIGEYFSSLDNLITLHQRELEKLQNIKKSMLEKMFV